MNIANMKKVKDDISEKPNDNSKLLADALTWSNQSYNKKDHRTLQDRPHCANKPFDSEQNFQCESERASKS